MNNDHAFRNPGGTRGIDDVGRVLGPERLSSLGVDGVERGLVAKSGLGIGVIEQELS